MSLVGSLGGECPVKCWYHHPAVKAAAGTEFLQTPDGKLYCRVGRDGKFEPQGEVRAGSKIDLAGKVQLTLLEHLPHAKHSITFHSEPNEKELGDAAEVELAVGDFKRSVWLARNDPKYAFQWVATPRGELNIAMGDAGEPLGCALKLVKFTREVNPGGMGDAMYSSTVRLLDPPRKIDQQREISMNEPLTYGKYTYYQSNFMDRPGAMTSILSVAYDPGRWMKYAGSIMICGGVFVMFVTRSQFYRRVARRAS